MNDKKYVCGHCHAEYEAFDDADRRMCPYCGGSDVKPVEPTRKEV